MKRSEEVNLTKQIELIQAFGKKQKDLQTFYRNIDNLSLVSVQDLSFEKDIEFFKELTFILSVILSIIAKPHLSHRRDEILARSGEVSTISEEDFQKTLRDSSIWKDEGTGRLLPEYLYYHQYEDEIKIYENIFIVHLVNEISMIADHYSSLYLSLLNVANRDNNQLLQDDDAQLKAMDAVNFVIRRIDLIKSTYFYREVSKAKNKPKVFYPTNILLKDRLYNICFKFYKKMYVYDEKSTLNNHLFVYYFVLLLKILHDRKFELTTRAHKLMSANNAITVPDSMAFANEEYRITVEAYSKAHMFIFSYKDKDDDATSEHHLYIESDTTLKDVKIPPQEERIFSIEYLSLWHRSMVNEMGKVEILNQTLENEEKMLETLIDSHHFVVTGSEKVYSSYCPSCKNKNLVELNGYYRCPDCGAIYKFLKAKGEEKTNRIVFARLNNYGRK